jgi:hypothetical protein
MDSLTTFTYNKVKYVLLEDIKDKELNNAFFIGCKTIRRCVDKHKIPEDKCVYMKNDKIYSKDYKSADLYIEHHYVKTNILDIESFKNKKTNDKKEEKNKRKEKRIEENNKRKEFDENDVEDAPEVLHLDDTEMFKTEEGVAMDIETRGEKTQDGIFFKASDIGKAFDYERIMDVITHTNGNHQYMSHYKYFNVKNKRCLYLTYNGLLKLLFCTRGTRSVVMQNMITKTIFTTGFGNQDSKDELAAKMLKVDKAVITEVFRKSCGRVSCVYLFKIGRVGDMRNHFNLDGFTDDDAFLYKYGQTNNLVRRTSDHTRSYGQLKNNSFDLSLFSYIDVVYVSDAEACLREYANKYNIRVKDNKYNELIVLEKHEYSEINTLYQEIYDNFSGKNSVVVQQLQDIQNNFKVEQLQHTKHIQELETKLELQERDMQLRLKDIELTYLRKINDMYTNK